MHRLLSTPDKLLALYATRLPILKGANRNCGAHLLHGTQPNKYLILNVKPKQRTTLRAPAVVSARFCFVKS